MADESTNKTADFSNGSVLLASGVTINAVTDWAFAKSIGFSPSVILVSLVVAYLLARRINGCLIPLARVTFIWATFSGGFLSIGIPALIYFEAGFKRELWSIMFVGFLYLLFALAVHQYMLKRQEREDRT